MLKQTVKYVLLAAFLWLAAATIYHAVAATTENDILDITEKVCYKANKEYRAKGTTTFFESIMDRIPSKEVRADLAYACYFYRRGFDEGYKV